MQDTSIKKKLKKFEAPGTYLLFLPLPYASLALFAYLKFGIIAQFSVAIVLAAFFPLLAYLRRTKEFIRDIAPFVTSLLCYEALQGITGVVVSSSSLHYLSSLDQSIFGLNVVGFFQKTFLSSTTTFISVIFYGLHFVLVGLATILFWLTKRSVFRGYTLAMAIVSYLSLLTFILLPTAPPWFAGDGVNLISVQDVFTRTVFGPVESLLLAFESDKFAAFPSLHIAYAFIFLLYTIKLKKVLSVISIPVFSLIVFSVIYLGQHYAVDVIGGTAYALFSFLLAEKINSLYPNP